MSKIIASALGATMLVSASAFAASDTSETDADGNAPTVQSADGAKPSWDFKQGREQERGQGKELGQKPDFAAIKALREKITAAIDAGDFTAFEAAIKGTPAEKKFAKITADNFNTFADADKQIRAGQKVMESLGISGPEGEIGHGKGPGNRHGGNFAPTTQSPTVSQ